MNQNEIEEKVRTILSDVLGVELESIDERTSPDTVKGWDSLHHLTLVLALEEEFEIAFDDEETLGIVSFPLIIEVVSERLGTAEPR